MRENNREVKRRVSDVNFYFCFGLVLYFFLLVLLFFFFFLAFRAKMGQCILALVMAMKFKACADSPANTEAVTLQTAG